MPIIERRLVGDDTQIVYNGRNLYAPLSPRLSAERRASNFLLQPDTLYLIASPLIGYGIDRLLIRCPPGSHFFCLELDHHLAKETLLPQKWHATEQISWLVAPNRAAIERHIRTLLMRRLASNRTGRASGFRRVELLSLSGGLAAQNEGYQVVFTMIENHIRAGLQNRMATLFLGRLWISNVLENLAISNTCRGIDALSITRAIMLAGAGPSLESSIPLIRQFRERLCLIAVDTALPILLAHRINPDIVVIVEAQHANMADFLSPVANRKPYPLICCDLISYSSAIRRFPPEQIIFFVSKITGLTLLDDLDKHKLLPPIIPSLGSVGVSATWIALLARSSARQPIFLTGLDFCYQIGKTHAIGAPIMQYFSLSSCRLNPNPAALFCLDRPAFDIADKQEELVRSELILHSYCEHLREIIRTNPKIIDIGKIGLQLQSEKVSTTHVRSLLRNAPITEQSYYLDLSSRRNNARQMTPEYRRDSVISASNYRATTSNAHASSRATAKTHTSNKNAVESHNTIARKNLNNWIHRSKSRLEELERLALELVASAVKNGAHIVDDKQPLWNAFASTLAKLRWILIDFIEIPLESNKLSQLEINTMRRIAVIAKYYYERFNRNQIRY